MSRIIKGFVAFVLIAVIVGGLGYIGYSYFFMNNVGLNMGNGSDYSANMANGSTGSMGGMNMGGSMNMQNQQGNNMIVETVKGILSNKGSLDNAISAFNDSLASLTMDPYGPSKSAAAENGNSSQTGSMGGMQMPAGAAMPDNTATPNASTNNVNGSTTINIYPDSNNTGTSQGSSTSNMTMKDMGTRYDAAKMEKLHSGLYKLAVGMQLLDQLNNEFLTQAEVVRTANTNDPASYYSNQYTLLLQDKNKLNQALNYINEAADLVNINPYVSDNGLVYDQDRMLGIHESIFKLAKGVALLNQLNDELLKQALNASYNAQNALNNQSMAGMTGMSGQINQDSAAGANGLFGNINWPSMINIILIVFVALFILGLLGAILTLFKSPQQNVNK